MHLRVQTKRTQQNTRKVALSLPQQQMAMTLNNALRRVTQEDSSYTARGHVERHVYCSVQEESFAAVQVKYSYIHSHKLPLRNIAPVERPRDATAMCLLLCEEHGGVSVLVLVRGATVDFRDALQSQIIFRRNGPKLSVLTRISYRTHFVEVL